MTIRRMTCGCCGEDAGRATQWWNQDAGYGICRPCAIRLHYRRRNADGSLGGDNYGYEGKHWATREQWAANVAGGWSSRLCRAEDEDAVGPSPADQPPLVALGPDSIDRVRQPAGACPVCGGSGRAGKAGHGGGAR